MIRINLEELQKILCESYKKGWKGSLDLCDSVAEEIAGRFEEEPEKKKGDQLYLFDESHNVTVNGDPAVGVDPADRSSWSAITAQTIDGLSFTINSTPPDGNGITWIEEEGNS